MKHTIYILTLLLLVSCSASKAPTENRFQPSKFVFKKSVISSQSGISKLKSMTDSLIDAAYVAQGKDSLMNKTRLETLLETQLTNLISQTPETEIYIEVHNDSIWRYTKQNGTMIGDYLMIQINSGILNYYDKSKSVNYRKYDLFNESHEYEIVKNRTTRKKIKGYDCYKLTLIEKDTESELGNTIYEMYVTDQIELPIHSVINISKFVPNSFPMEILVFEENLSGLADLYELIEIK
jgi:hypothetical protein